MIPFPLTNGYALRVWGIVRTLAESGHDVDLLSFGDPVALAKVEGEILKTCRTAQAVPHPRLSLSARTDLVRRAIALGSRWPYGIRRSRSEAMRERLAMWMAAHPKGLILCEETYALVNLPEPLPIPVIIDHHNAEHVILMRYAKVTRNPLNRAYAWLEGTKLRRWERTVSGKAAMVLTCSEADRRVFQSLCPETPVIVAPNVVDVDSYSSGGESGEPVVLYTGGMDWYPNRDAVEYFARETMPILRRMIPRLRFVVAGRGPTEDFRRKLSGSPDIEFTGTVEDMRPVIASAAVCVVPLRIGSGTRLKIIEAAASGKAVVSTRLGAEGLLFEDRNEILLAETPEEFAREVSALLGDAAYRRRVGDAARRKAEREYSLAALRRALAEALPGLRTQGNG